MQARAKIEKGAKKGAAELIAYGDYIFEIKTFTKTTCMPSGIITLKKGQIPFKNLFASVFNGKDGGLVFDVVANVNGVNRVLLCEQPFEGWDVLIERLIALLARERRG